MKFRYIPVLILISVLGCADTSRVITSSANWAEESGLSNVESIIHDSSNKCFYASNGKEYKAGTDGFISKISESGEVTSLKWVEGLNRPTGMAIRDSILYVADVNVLVLIDISTGSIIDRLAEPIANSGLNDVAIDQNGDIFVTASFVHSVFKVINGTLEPWLRGDEKLTWANGILVHQDQLLVGGMNLNSIDIASKEIKAIDMGPIAKDFDGLTKDGAGGYFLSTVENSALWHINKSGKVMKLSDGEAYFGDMDYIPSLNKLYVARGNLITSDFFITEYSLN